MVKQMHTKCPNPYIKLLQWQPTNQKTSLGPRNMYLQFQNYQWQNQNKKKIIFLESLV